ncbi:hypothetical protein [Thermophilibacter provencensis]|uniref:Uncharacterized protein n=1 Tax=Thermophilibacter provencensis TaxID=1852386 RepID=A0ABT7V4C2_9ACTN|nr:hypothetical protein [Thermophilibacter provencensis]MDM8271445.1 hypothetical protein [Thermophilibacter provencensis]
MFNLDAVDAYDMCANRVEIIRELLLESMNRIMLPKDEEGREQTEWAVRYLGASLDVAEAALREHDSFVQQRRAA